MDWAVFLVAAAAIRVGRQRVEEETEQAGGVRV